MVGWHHQLNGLEFEQALEVGEGQGNLVCYSPWGRKESDTSEQQINDFDVQTTCPWLQNFYVFWLPSFAPWSSSLKWCSWD